MRKGEVWRVRLPLETGHVQAGERPAVIIENDTFIPLLPTAMVVPFTASQGARRFPATLFVPPDGQNGLTAPSLALVFQTRALDKRNMIRRLGTLDATSLAQILQILLQFTA